MPPAVMELHKVGMAFAKPSEEQLAVLSGIDLSIREGEILGLLGRSGSGKSTLLRIAGGLIAPTAGEVIYQGHALKGPEEGISIVFQSFALYPWLTVEENVELGLDALSLSAPEKTARCRAAIDLIGLDGFQSAYPRELSGGMRQRVGFARAIVSNPILLLMDEPFSALDVLTAETLRTDFLDLWGSHQLPTKAVLMVTHNIEEAVLMCDDILVLGADPGHVVAEVPVALPRPRDRLDPNFLSLVERIYSILTARLSERNLHPHGIQYLPDAAINRITGLIMRLASPPYDGGAELAAIAAPLGLKSAALLSVAAALHLLGFAELSGSTIKLTAAGRVFAQSDTDRRKQLFREHLLCFVPFAGHIHQVLEERDSHDAPRERFELELQDHLHRNDAEATLRTAIGWGRYAELFFYDDRRRIFSLRPAGGKRHNRPSA